MQSLTKYLHGMTVVLRPPCGQMPIDTDAILALQSIACCNGMNCTGGKQHTQQSSNKHNMCTTAMCCLQLCIEPPDEPPEACLLL